jgi:carboxyl-terminal processing protease
MKKYTRNILIFLVSIAMLAGAYALGVFVGTGALSISKAGIKIVNVNLGKPQNVDFSVFWEAWNKIKEKYVGKIDEQAMFYGAAQGMVEALNDPYSSFMPPKDTKKFNEELSGKLEGIGAEVSKKDNQIILTPLEGSPAQKAGVLAGDVLIKINAEDAQGLSVEEAVQRIRGPAGTEVKLTLLRDDNPHAIEITITRNVIEIPSVSWKMLEKNIAHLKISRFGDDTETALAKAIGEIISKGAKGVILDLRNNPGGLLDAGINVANMFLEQGKVIVSEVDKAGNKTVFKAEKVPKLADLPLVVLVNKGSASASEIVAGALKDNGRARLVGETTFGKGSVQEISRFKDDSSLRITVAKWLTPGGKSIDNEGLTPDVLIKMTEEDIKSGKDPQLERCLDEFK